MLDALPREPEWRSWLHVALWSLVIFVTIPFARALRETVAERIGVELFLYSTVVVALIGGAWALASLRKRQVPTGAYLWLFGVVVAFIAYAYHLRRIPEEAIHVAEYGVLGLLVYRALSHRIHDYTIYPVAAIMVGMIGMLDEYIQWAVPSRVFDLRDIRTNFIAGALSQVAIAGGLRPSIVASSPSSRSLSRLCKSIALAVFVLALSYANTPRHVEWYATRVPFLSFLLESGSVMADYGYLFRDPDIGAFKSRFSREQLEREDARRGTEVAQILDHYIGGVGYQEFLQIYTVPSDPYAHEAGVHLFRRNRYLEKAQLEEVNRDVHSTVALRENQILEKYYPTIMSHSRHAWPPEILSYLDGYALKEEEYTSYVSRGLVTRLSEKQVFLAFALAIAALLLLGAYLGRDRPDALQSSARRRS